MTKLSIDAEKVAGAWFGMMKPDGKSHLRFGLQRSRPSARAAVALAELVCRKIISHEVESSGAHVYRPMVDCSPFFRRHLPRALAGEKGFPLTEAIDAEELGPSIYDTERPDGFIVINGEP